MRFKKAVQSDKGPSIKDIRREGVWSNADRGVQSDKFAEEITKNEPKIADKHKLGHKNLSFYLKN